VLSSTVTLSAYSENAWFGVSLPIWTRRMPLPSRFALDVWWTSAPLTRTSTRLRAPFTRTRTWMLPQVASGSTPVVVLNSPLCWT